MREVILSMSRQEGFTLPSTNLAVLCEVLQRSVVCTNAHSLEFCRVAHLCAWCSQGGTMLESRLEAAMGKVKYFWATLKI